MVNIYLVLAYGFLWLIFILYAWSLSRRQSRLRKEIEDLKNKILIPEASPKSPSPPGR